MKSRSILGAAITAALLTSSLVHADELNEVVVTATRYPTPIKDVLAPTIVITRAELDRNVATDVTDVLRFHAGIDIGRTGGIGQTASAFIRGTDSNHTLVLVDGVRLNPGTIGAAALQNLNPAMIERIEIVKGPRSTLYGTDAVGGVIQIFTRARGARGITGEASYGANDTRTAQGSAGWSHDAARAAIAVSWLDTEGFAPRKDDPRGGAHDNLSVNLSGGIDAGGGEMFAQYWRSEGSTDYIGFSSRDFDSALVTQDHASEAGSVGYSWSKGDWRTQISVTTMLEEYEQGRVQDSLGSFESSDSIRTRRHGIDWQNDLEISENQRLVFGATHSQENAKTAASFTDFDVDTDITTAFVQDHFKFGRSSATLGAGYTDHESFGGHATWTAEYGYDITDKLRVIASGGTAFRAPDATDRFGFGGDPNLDPERSRNYELSARYELTAAQLISFSAFQNRITDLITVELDPETFEFQARNVDEARIRGVELGYQLAQADWSLRADAIYQEPEDLSNDTRLLRRARETFTLNATRQFGIVDVSADFLWHGQRHDFGGVRLDSYTLLNLSAQARIAKDWQVFARVENVLNDQYEVAANYNSADRGVFVGIRYSPEL